MRIVTCALAAKSVIQLSRLALYFEVAQLESFDFAFDLFEDWLSHFHETTCVLGD